MTDGDFNSKHAINAPRLAESWSRRVQRLIGFVDPPAAHNKLRRVPVFRIERLCPDRWIAGLRDSMASRVFPDLEEAVAFIKHESGGSRATVELRIDDLYIVAQLDPDQSSSLFGETITECARAFSTDELL